MDYTDENWDGDFDGRTNTSGSALFLGVCLVSWTRRKQS